MTPRAVTTGWRGQRFLLARRAVQISVLLLFLAGPWWGITWLQGNLSASQVLHTVPLTDPFVWLQTLMAGHTPQAQAALGAAIVLVFYALVGGRSYCAWVCPVNAVTDSAAWLRERWGWRTGVRVSRRARWAMLALALGLPLILGVVVWELVNPVSLLQRGLLFGMGLGWAVVAAVFMADLLLAPRAWCGHLCPHGAFYSLLGVRSLLRVRAQRREDCDDCGDCYRVCPEPQILKPVLKGEGSRLIDTGQCSNCGRCIDRCPQDVFEMGWRGTGRAGPNP